MKLEPGCPLYLFDTSGLLDFAQGKARGSVRMQALLSLTGQYFYHPISLAEMADYVHEPIWRHRRPSDARWAEKARARRSLITLLYHHRKEDRTEFRLYERRFLPFHTTFRYFSLVAHQRQQVCNIRTTQDGPVCVAALTDHQILTSAVFFHRTGVDVTFVSGDQQLLGAAAHFNVKWVYSKDPDRSAAFVW